MATRAPVREILNAWDVVCSHYDCEEIVLAFRERFQGTPEDASRVSEILEAYSIGAGATID